MPQGPAEGPKPEAPTEEAKSPVEESKPDSAGPAEVAPALRRYTTKDVRDAALRVYEARELRVNDLVERAKELETALREDAGYLNDVLRGRERLEGLTPKAREAREAFQNGVQELYESLRPPAPAEGD